MLEVVNIYREEEFIALEEEERNLTDEAIAVMLLLIANTKGNLENELRKFYQQYGRDGVVTYAEARKWVSSQDHQRRLTALTLYLSGEFVSLLDDLETQFHRFLTEVIGKESTFFGIKIDVDDLLTTPWGFDDLNWLERLRADVDLWQAYIANDWKRALHRGATINEVLAQLDKRFKSIGNVLETLGLSESTALGSLGRRAIFKKLGVTHYQFYTKADERTCETCGSMHGLIFPISAFEAGVTASPLHPRCRCWEVPITE